ncbi:hypothetical protein I302_104916 [Kwoniella bestiolae CBS 10118]|uniref:Uncharacterized protein n=1 Tax=Kwoniella bestiolae CBS 10118 TaxID=1296100 RepID=A0A1B9FRE0_9TREE|nr:hypothetical protein I302_09013 [Kwoniella bestiolae CBS 10118]OCF21339.1 hypothetical protein I302_09013 [Kwoniella bestiolae CBS 10118]
MHGSATTTRTTHHTSHRQNRIRGLQGAINNPRTTHSGRSHAEQQLHHMGVKPAHPSIGTRLRHFFHLPGISHGHRSTRKTHTPYSTTHTTTRTAY